MVLQLSLMVFGYYVLYCALYHARCRDARARSLAERDGTLVRFCLTRLTLRSTGPITERRGNWERARVHTESIFREFNRSQFVDPRASFICVIERKRSTGKRAGEEGSCHGANWDCRRCASTNFYIAESPLVVISVRARL